MADDLTYLLWFFVDLGQNSKADGLDLSNLASEASSMKKATIDVSNQVRIRATTLGIYGGLVIIVGDSVVVGVSCVCFFNLNWTVHYISYIKDLMH